MEASSEVTGHAQDTRHPETAGRAARRWSTRSKNIAAIAGLGLAGFLSVTACTSTTPAAAPAAPVPAGLHAPVPAGLHAPVPAGLHAPVPAGLHAPVPVGRAGERAAGR
jgi:hypothetical protein